MIRRLNYCCCPHPHLPACLTPLLNPAASLRPEPPVTNQDLAYNEDANCELGVQWVNRVLGSCASAAGSALENGTLTCSITVQGCVPLCGPVHLHAMLDSRRLQLVVHVGCVRIADWLDRRLALRVLPSLVS